jgi:ribosomal protein S18 acetylase RimI-like enzyme
MQLVEYLDWDSQFFGISIGRTCIDSNKLHSKTLDKAIEEARTYKIKCLYIEIPFIIPEVHEYCSENRFLLVDLKTTLSKKLNNEIRRLKQNNITYVLKKNFYPYLRKIVKQISLTSRYSFDLKFGREKSYLLYEEWLRKSFYEKYCDYFIVYVKDDEPAGFLTINIKNGHPYIDLLGVSNEQRGKGIGKKLIKDAERELSEAGHDKLKVITQGHNINALNTYQSVNFKTENINLFYHKWID